MRILFMGTPEFAVPCIKALKDSEHTLCGAVTQPDKPAGRGHKLTPPPVKKFALENGIEVFQPQTLKDRAFERDLKRLDPEMIIVVAYGKILPEYILNYPKFGCINMHASLLPKYRGAGPIQWAVINGEKKTGITSMLMEKGLDTGDMLLKCETEIGEYETASELHDRLMYMGAELMLETIRGIEKGTIEPKKQDDSLSCYAPMINKEKAKIDWNKPAEDIIHLIHGMNSWPVAHTLYEGTRLRVYRAKKGALHSEGQPGEIVNVSNDGIEVVGGDGAGVVLTEVQFEGSKTMSVRDYLNGHEVRSGVVLS